MNFAQSDTLLNECYAYVAPKPHKSVKVSIAAQDVVDASECLPDTGCFIKCECLEALAYIGV